MSVPPRRTVARLSKHASREGGFLQRVGRSFVERRVESRCTSIDTGPKDSTRIVFVWGIEQCASTRNSGRPGAFFPADFLRGPRADGCGSIVEGRRLQRPHLNQALSSRKASVRRGLCAMHCRSYAAGRVLVATSCAAALRDLESTRIRTANYNPLRPRKSRIQAAMASASGARSSAKCPASITCISAWGKSRP